MDLSAEAAEAVRRLPAICDALAAQGMDTHPLIVEPPASASDVAAMEEQIGIRLPDSFRRVITSISRRVNFTWFAPDLDTRTHGFPKPFDQIFCGDLSWSLAGIPDLLAYHQSWIDNCIDIVWSDPDDPFAAVWHNTFPLMSVGNGDFLAIDLDDTAPGRVIYLKHEEGEGHGFSMAPSFEDLLVRWIPLACPGGEEWQWMPFCSADAGGIDPTSEVAREWIERMNLSHGLRSAT